MATSRQLSAIMFTDIVGYTALMEDDEQKAFELLKRNRSIQQPIVKKYHGTWLKEIGDGVLCSFKSAIDAVYCAIEIQQACLDQTDLKLRIGIHQGDVVLDGDDIFGSGVNIASRLEPLAPIGGILVSEAVQKNLVNKRDIHTISLGEKELRGVKERVKVFQVYVEKSKPGIDPKLQVHRQKMVLSQGKSNRRNRYLQWGTGALFLFVLGYFLLNNIYGSYSGRENSIAVLPITVIGDDLESSAFAAGVRDFLINQLNEIEDLQVRSRTSVDRVYGQGDISFKEIAEELDVSYIIEASAQKYQEDIRIIVQLIDTKIDDHVWQNNYDREFKDIFDVQSEIARKIAAELQVTISKDVDEALDRVPTQNSQAWNDYLKAQFFLQRYLGQRLPEDLESSVSYLQSSLRHDPNFALGYSYLALAYSQFPGDPALSFNFTHPDSVLTLCNKAIALDPELSDPYAMRADHFAYVVGDAETAEVDYLLALKYGHEQAMPYWRYGAFKLFVHWQPAIALKLFFQGLTMHSEPYVTAQILTEIAWAYLTVGDYRQAELYLDKALGYDPENIQILGYKGHLYLMTRKYEQLYLIAQDIMKISPLNHGLWELGQYYLITGDYAKSANYFDQYFREASETSDIAGMINIHMFAYALLRVGRIQEAEERFVFAKSLLRTLGHGTLDYEYAKIFAAQSKIDSAYYHLEKAVKEGPIHWGMPDFMGTDPLFSDITDQERFKQLTEIARTRRDEKREEVRRLEASGEIPSSIDEVVLY